MENAPKIENKDIEARLGELLLSLAIPGRAVYIDVYPVDPQNPQEYTYDYWETRLDGASSMQEFRNGTE